MLGQSINGAGKFPAAGKISLGRAGGRRNPADLLGCGEIPTHGTGNFSPLSREPKRADQGFSLLFFLDGTRYRPLLASFVENIGQIWRFYRR
jgi:hypothetical protein